MSKEMTPKESIQIIQDNITPRTLGILTVEFNIVEKALDRLEQLEIADRNNQNLVKTNVELVNKNLDLQKENQELKEKAKKYDEIVNLKTTPNVIEKSLADYMNKCIALENEIEKIRGYNKTYRKMIEAKNTLIFKYEQSIEKLEKVIKILKDKKVVVGYLLLCPTLGNYNRPTSEEYQLTQQEYDLLKEVLE